jgi:hypothetical protein
VSPLPALAGGCHCGNIAARAELTSAPQQCQPRACDCEFCRKHGAAWWSDPRGSLHIHIADEADSGRYRQGAGLAEMLLCRRCGVLVAALWQGSQASALYGVVNVTVLDARSEFPAAQPVSPQQLAPEAKVSRWQSIWFPSVRLTSGALAGA